MGMPDKAAAVKWLNDEIKGAYAGHDKLKAGGLSDAENLFKARLWHLENIHALVQESTVTPVIEAMRDALQKIVDMNRQTAQDQYGDAEKAEGWACVTVSRAAIAEANKLMGE